MTRPIDLRATYRLQLSSEFGFADARALVPYLRDLGISHLYLSPSLQARRAPRTATTSSTRGASPASSEGPRSWARSPAPRARPGWGSCSTSSRTTWPPTIRTATGPTRSCAQQFFDIEPGTGRYRRFFDIDELAGVRQEDPEVFEETHELVIALVREGLIDGLRVDHPDGLADPAGYLAPPARPRRRARLGREDPRSRGAAARLAGVRDGRLRVPQRRVRAVRRPGRRSPHSPRCGSRSRAIGARSPRSPTRPSSSRCDGPFWQDVERLARELGDTELRRRSGGARLTRSPR